MSIMPFDPTPGNIDLCSHPLCLLTYLGPHINRDDPDDFSALFANLQTRGFSPDEQRELTSELRWAWIEQSLALTRYLYEGVWDGPGCEIHDDDLQVRRDGAMHGRPPSYAAAKDQYDLDDRRLWPQRQNRKNDTSLDSRHPVYWKRDFLAAAANDDPSLPTTLPHDPLTAENLSQLDRSQLACAAERVTLAARLSADYHSETGEVKQRAAASGLQQERGEEGGGGGGGGKGFASAEFHPSTSAYLPAVCAPVGLPPLSTQARPAVASPPPQQHHGSMVQWLAARRASASSERLSPLVFHQRRDHAPCV